ncbi:MAG: hypothetical protein ACLQVD_10300 [Capsulimonadaceae bacterium]
MSLFDRFFKKNAEIIPTTTDPVPPDYGNMTFPADCAEDDIRAAIVTWSELLAAGKFAEALAMFGTSSMYFGYPYTPEMLEDCICNYGTPRADYDCGEYHKLTSLYEQPDPEDYILKAIEIDRNPARFAEWKGGVVGAVANDNVPLDGSPSDLTANFHIKVTPSGDLWLEFLDIHVM